MQTEIEMATLPIVIGMELEGKLRIMSGFTEDPNIVTPVHPTIR